MTIRIVSVRFFALLIFLSIGLNLSAQILTDTSRSGGRGGGRGQVPISTITNTINIPTTMPTNPVVTTVTTTTPAISTQTPTVEDLSRKVNDLQNQLNGIQSKLPFQNMAMMVIEASEKNMEKKTSETGSTYFLHQIKIDNPLCNANPKAVVIVMNLSDKDHMQLVNAFYNVRNKYWYISTPQVVIKGFDPVVNYLSADITVTKPEYVFDTQPFSENSRGLAYAGPKYPNVGDKFSVLIFDQLPNVNPAYNQLINRMKE